MSCEAYREKLSDTLLSGEAALNEAVAAHLRACPDWIEFYEAQKQLLGAMDLGVRAMVNEEMPASLLAGVHTRMKETPVARPWPMWFVPAAGIVVVVALLSLIPLRRRHFSQMPSETPVDVAKTPARFAGGAGPAEGVANGESAMRSVRGKAPTRKLPWEVSAPEVIVLPAERAALAKAEWMAPRITEEPAATGNASEEVAEKLEVTPLKIDEIVIPAIDPENDE